MTEEVQIGTPRRKPRSKLLVGFLVVGLLVANLVYLTSLVQKSQEIRVSAESLRLFRNKESTESDVLETVVWNSRCQTDELCRGGLACKPVLNDQGGYCCTASQCAIKGGCVVEETRATGSEGKSLICEAGEWVTGR